TGFNKDAEGNVTEILCEYQPDSRGGDPADGHKVKGATIHWVNSLDCVDATVNLYSYLFSDPDPDGSGKDYIDCLNPESLTVVENCKIESSVRNCSIPDKSSDSLSFQFIRQGYFCVDSIDSTPEHLVFNRSVALKDSYKK
ncbi:MAG: glutamine--tRNA ligase, partial [Oscillospiraceae bacterium]|nr:glutamine--tRNA ligase [Oscillospiraceae bacterium]